MTISKICRFVSFVGGVAIAGFLTLALGNSPACAQVETVLHNFADGTVANDGEIPYAGLTLASDGNYYGTTQYGGSTASGGQNDGLGWGAVYKTTPNGVVTILHSFGDGTVANDGLLPYGGLIQAKGGNFYGLAWQGGSAGDGAVYSITSAGVVTILHSFGDGSVASDGQEPYGNLVQASDGNFYGTTSVGGSAGGGTVFKMTPSGAVTILHSFRNGSVPGDGYDPVAGLIQGSDGDLYGTTENGGTAGYGTVFKMTITGDETVLHSFEDGSVQHDGLGPYAGVVEGRDGNYYGTTYQGGSTIAKSGVDGDGWGTVYKVTPTGTLTILHSFGDGSVADDGTFPEAGLILATDGNFYGTTIYGASSGAGCAFEITPAGKLTILHAFPDGAIANDGAYPQAGLTQGPGGFFFGTTGFGGSQGDGTVFKLYVPSPFRFDFNGDWKDDLLWQNGQTGQLVVWDMNGTTTSTRGSVFATVPPVWKVEGVADINGDGHPDVLWWNSSNGEVLFWEMTGASGTSVLSQGKPIGAVANTQWQPVSMADFTGNGHPDILWENMTTGQLVVWYLNGSAVSSYGSVFATLPADCRVAGTADFNQDGRPDILVENTTTGAVNVWYMGGAAGTTVESEGAAFADLTNTDWQIVSTGDTNGDGHPDLTWRNSSTGQVVVWLMGGALGTTIESEGAPLLGAPASSWDIVGVK